MNHPLRTITLAAILWGCSTQAQAQLLIDQFNSPAAGQLLVDFPGGGPASSSAADLGIGGIRDVSLTALGVSGLPAIVGINVFPSRLSIANPTDVVSRTVILYDAGGAGLGDIDLITPGYDAVSFDLEVADHPGNLTIEFFDSGTVATATVPLPLAPPSTAFLVPFGSFSVVGSGDPFTSLDKVKLTFDVPSAGDIRIAEIDFLRNNQIGEGKTLYSTLGLGAFLGTLLFRRVKS